MRRSSLILGLVAVSLWAAPARADNTESADAFGGGSDDPEVAVRSTPDADRAAFTGPQGKTPVTPCRPGEVLVWSFAKPTCFRLQPSGPGDPAPPASVLADEARRLLPLVVPAFRTSPPRGSETLVGFDTWFIVGPEAWEPAEATAEVPGVWAAVRATPVLVEFSGRDGDREWRVQCDPVHNPPVAYDPELPAGSQRSGCWYRWNVSSAGEPGEAYTVTVTMTWELRWWASTGEGGALPDAMRSTTFDVRVAEAQAVVTG